MPLNLYADLAMFQTRVLNNPASESYDLGQVEFALEQASRRVDSLANRKFFTVTAARVFDGTGRDPNNVDYLSWATRTLFTQSMSFIRIPDLLSATSVLLDQDSSRAFATPLAAGTDYYLLAEGANDQDGLPYTKLQLDIFNSKVVTVFSSRPRLVKVTGTWGYPSDMVTESVTGTLASATTTTLTTTGAGGLARGQTLLIGSEQLYVTGGSGTSWTVTRGVNGTTAAAAPAGSAIQRYVYVAQVREAALLGAIDLLKDFGPDELVADSSGTTRLLTRPSAGAAARDVKLLHVLSGVRRHYV